MKNQSRYVLTLFIIMTSVVLMCCLFGCGSVKKSQQQKDYEASLAHAKILEEARTLFPCDTSHIVVTKTDTAFVFISDTTYKNDTAFVTKTKTVTNTIYRTATVVDSAYGQLWHDRYDQAGYLLQNAKDQSDKIAADNTKKDTQISTLKEWRKWTVSILGGLFVGAIVFLYFKLKP